MDIVIYYLDGYAKKIKLNDFNLKKFIAWIEDDTNNSSFKFETKQELPNKQISNYDSYIFKNGIREIVIYK